MIALTDIERALMNATIGDRLAGCYVAPEATGFDQQAAAGILGGQWDNTWRWRVLGAVDEDVCGTWERFTEGNAPEVTGDAIEALFRGLIARGFVYEADGAYHVSLAGCYALGRPVTPRRAWLTSRDNGGRDAG